ARPGGAAVVSAQVHVQPDHGPAGEGPQLDQVAELVDHPQPAAAVAVEGRPLPADHRVPDAAAVTDLAHQRPVVPPDPQGAAAATVAQAVGGDLVDGQHQAGGGGRGGGARP